MNQKAPEEMAEEWVKYDFPDGGECCEVSFLAGYKAAEDKYKAQIEELETQLENWQHNAKHGDEGL